MLRNFHKRSTISVAFSLMWTEIRYAPSALLVELGLFATWIILAMPFDYPFNLHHGVDESFIPHLVLWPAVFVGVNDSFIREGRLHLFGQVPLNVDALAIQRFLRVLFSSIPYMIAAPFWLIYLDIFGYVFSRMTAINMPLLIVLISSLSLFFPRILVDQREVFKIMANLLLRVVIITPPVGIFISNSAHSALDHGSWGVLAEPETLVVLLVLITATVLAGVLWNRELILRKDSR